MKLKIRGDSSSEDITKAIRNQLNVGEHFVLIDEEGINSVVDHTLSAGTYRVHVHAHDEKAKTFAVVGATGGCGAAAVQHLSKLYGKHHRILAIVRDVKSDKVKGLTGLQGVTLVNGDMGAPAELTKTLHGVDSVVVVTPSHADRVKLTTAGFDAAHAAGVKHLVVVSLPTAGMDNIFGRHFGAIEAHAKKSGMTWTILRLPMFNENIWGHAASIKAQGAFYSPSSPATKIDYIAVDDIGHAIACLLANPHAHSGKTYIISNGPHSNAELAEMFTKTLGKEIKHVQVSFDQAKQAFMGMGMQEWQVDGVLELLKLAEAGGPAMVSEYKAITGHEPMSLDAWVNQVGGGFK